MQRLSEVEDGYSEMNVHDVGHTASDIGRVLCHSENQDLHKLLHLVTMRLTCQLQESKPLKMELYHCSSVFKSSLPALYLCRGRLDTARLDWSR